MRNKINLKTATFEELEQECQDVLGTMYGHNMIGIICSIAEERFGKDKAKYLFNNYQL